MRELVAGENGVAISPTAAIQFQHLELAMVMKEIHRLRRELTRAYERLDYLERVRGWRVPGTR